MADETRPEANSSGSDTSPVKGSSEQSQSKSGADATQGERKPYRGQRRSRRPRGDGLDPQRSATELDQNADPSSGSRYTQRPPRTNGERREPVVPPIRPQVIREQNDSETPLSDKSQYRSHLPRFSRAPDAPADVQEAKAQPASRRRRNPRTKQRTDDPVRYSVDSHLANVTRTDNKSSRRANQRIGRSRNGRPLGRYLMCVHKADDFVQIAVLEGRTLIEHYVSKVGIDPNAIDGNIYLGRVTNVLAGMEAAFVDIGTTKNAVLYRGDVRYDRDDLIEHSNREVRIEHLLRPRQVALCQITKNPIGTKGARLTQEVSLPGRFVVLVPNSDSYGISKRLPDDERRRLRRILGDLKPAGFGVIVRTAAEGASADELSRDISQLVETWNAIEARSKTAHAPTLLYSEPNVAVRVIREEFNRNYRGVIIDDRAIFDEVYSYVDSISPELADRVEYYDPKSQGLPLFELHHVHEQLHKAMDRRVWLPSGGYLVIDRAEALTVIDVNTGKNVGTVSLEETIHQVNVEAADEIARQLRLRDIGGIIVIDFIDMSIEANKADVMKALKDSLSRDKTKTQVFEMSALGLVEMTRQRVSEGLVEALSDICPTCKGRGMVFMDVDMM